MDDTQTMSDTTDTLLHYGLCGQPRAQLENLVGTVAILAQGTHWAVAVMQAFFLFFVSASLSLRINQTNMSIQAIMRYVMQELATSEEAPAPYSMYCPRTSRYEPNTPQPRHPDVLAQ